MLIPLDRVGKQIDINTNSIDLWEGGEKGEHLEEISPYEMLIWIRLNDDASSEPVEMTERGE